MKVIFLALCFLPSLARANAIQFDGIFASPSSTFDMTDNAADCVKNGGKWNSESEEDGICVYDVEDLVTVSHKEGSYFLEASTWGSNGHSCNYEGKAELVGNTIVSESKSEYDEAASCKLTVTYLDANTVSVSEDESGNCRYWCGARAFGFGIEKATRK